MSTPSTNPTTPAHFEFLSVVNLRPGDVFGHPFNRYEVDYIAPRGDEFEIGAREVSSGDPVTFTVDSGAALVVDVVRYF
jgi:hypothetical protein